MGKNLKPFTKKLPDDKTNYHLLLDEEVTETFRAGLVTLGAGDSVGIHNTNSHEEVITVLHGTGEMEIKGNKNIPIEQGMIAYVPPFTEHNVRNTGSSELKYIFLVTKVQ
jgi:mannose-6-phosphate isomerase-like protein (cupin superfamily)